MDVRGDTGSAFSRPATELVIGGCLGLTWAAALRAYMIEIAGSASDFHWYATFGAVLLPGAIAGVGIALARQRQERDVSRAWLPSLALLGFVVLPMLRPGAVQQLLSTGEGSAAVGVVGALLLGGYGLGDRGSRAWRAVALAGGGLLSLGIAAVPGFSGPATAMAEPLSTPRGVWAVTLGLGLMVAGSLATSLAFRRPRAAASREGRLSA